MWKCSIAKSKSVAPKLGSLPPTDKIIFSELETKSLAVTPDLPTVDIYLYGWEKDSETK